MSAVAEPGADGAAPFFRYDPDPDMPGWMRWAVAGQSLFNEFIGPVRVRREDALVRVAIDPRPAHGNVRGQVHGGALLGFLDICLFAAARGFGVLMAGPAATVELSTQFLAGASLDRPLEARVELLRETGRFLFLRGLVVQTETNVASFSAIVRKPSRRAE